VTGRKHCGSRHNSWTKTPSTFSPVPSRFASAWLHRFPVHGCTGNDGARVMSVMQQFGINQNVPIFAGGGKDAFGRMYPETKVGALVLGCRPSEAPPENVDDQAFERARKAMARQDADVTGPLRVSRTQRPGRSTRTSRMRR
jgi:hypothetical protein